MTNASLVGAAAVCRLLLGPAQLGSQSLTIGSPWTTLDRVIPVAAHGLPAGQAATIRALSRDRSRRQWQASAVFHADAEGNVELSRMSPDSGSYSMVNPMGLFQAMDVAGDERGRVRFDAAWSDTIVTEILLELNGKIVATDTVWRTFASPQVRAAAVHEDGLVGMRFTPRSSAPRAHVLVLGGSEGGLSSADVAAQLASAGFDALALAYFGADSLPAQLVRIPLEYFGKALRLLSRDSVIGRAPIAVLGSSKGAEAALLVAVRYPQVSAVVAYAPSAVAWSCICDSTAHSSWTWHGEEVPAVPPGTDPTYQRPAGSSLRPAVNYGFRLASNQDLRTIIPIEETRARILLVAGGDDGLWPSATMAEALRKRRSTEKSAPPIEILLYQSAGHLIGKSYLPAGSTLLNRGRIDTGGNPTDNAWAQANSWPKVIRFLSDLRKRHG
ncbi:MAG: acyl-CoA thioesterase/BAAT N-terminal domain-containing protein [Gemmatimonadota bacterium]|nr:acyl-CoA thioesterase/BAAT N-terminal domain-containing protein [Gemmatimonadota bacterium]